MWSLERRKSECAKQNEYLLSLAKSGFDTAENEPSKHFGKPGKFCQPCCRAERPPGQAAHERRRPGARGAPRGRAPDDQGPVEDARGPAGLRPSREGLRRVTSPAAKLAKLTFFLQNCCSLCAFVKCLSNLLTFREALSFNR